MRGCRPPSRSRRVELATRVTPQTRATLARICGLFAIDAVAGGFLTTALLSFFFYERFGVDVASIGAAVLRRARGQCGLAPRPPPGWRNASGW